jgi:hypothetical protein
LRPIVIATQQRLEQRRNMAQQLRGQCARELEATGLGPVHVGRDDTEVIVDEED